MSELTVEDIQSCEMSNQNECTTNQLTWYQATIEAYIRLQFKLCMISCPASERSHKGSEDSPGDLKKPTMCLSLSMT